MSSSVRAWKPSPCELLQQLRVLQAVHVDPGDTFGVAERQALVGMVMVRS